MREIRSSLDGYMTRAQASKRLRMSPSYISRLMSLGKLSYVIVGRRRFPSALGVEALATLWGRLDLGGEVQGGHDGTR